MNALLFGGIAVGLLFLMNSGSKRKTKPVAASNDIIKQIDEDDFSMKERLEESERMRQRLNQSLDEQTKLSIDMMRKAGAKLL
jgi:hypothetical protein